MELTPFEINLYTFFNLPSAWWCGVRVKKISSKCCSTKVNLNWINKNPFNSMFWAIQGMSAELSTGVLIMQASKSFKCDISMLVINNKATFRKKARGQIVFSCNNGEAVEKTFTKLFKTNKSQTLWLQAIGVDEEGDIVSTFDFEWTLLLK